QAEGQVGLQRPALLAASPIASGQPWLRGEVGIAITDAAPLQVVWDTSEPSLAIGSSYPAKVKVTRAAGIKGPVRLSALTSQLIPRTPDGRMDDNNRALRLVMPVVIPAEQSAGVASILVPGDLPALSYDLAIQADLLGSDGRTV